MNFLGHIFLSFDNKPLMSGNFIGDFVRGKEYENYPPEVQKGILLHRQIDQFTDQHPAVKECVKKLRPQFGKYSAVIPDVFFDYFLAKNWNQYSEQDLPEFCQETYAYLDQQKDIFPPKVQLFLPYMIQQNWLLNYGQIWGIRKALEGLERRAKYADNLSNAVEELIKNEHFYESYFQEFIPEITTFVLNKT